MHLERGHQLEGASASASVAAGASDALEHSNVSYYERGGAPGDFAGGGRCRP